MYPYSRYDEMIKSATETEWSIVGGIDSKEYYLDDTYATSGMNSPKVSSNPSLIVYANWAKKTIKDIGTSYNTFVSETGGKLITSLSSDYGSGEDASDLSKYKSVLVLASTVTTTNAKGDSVTFAAPAYVAYSPIITSPNGTQV